MHGEGKPEKKGAANMTNHRDQMALAVADAIIRKLPTSWIMYSDGSHTEFYKSMNVVA